MPIIGDGSVSRKMESKCPECGHWQECTWIQHPTRAIGIYDWMTCEKCGVLSSVESECDTRSIDAD